MCLLTPLTSIKNIKCEQKEIRIKCETNPEEYEPYMTKPTSKLLIILGKEENGIRSNQI